MRWHRCCGSCSSSCDGPPPQAKRKQKFEVEEESSGLPLVLGYCSTGFLEDRTCPVKGLLDIMVSPGENSRYQKWINFTEFGSRGSRYGHEPDFIATLGGQRNELVRSSLLFIAIPGGEPSKFTWRLSAKAGAVFFPRLRR